ncbi:MAG TPA: hypothetical protein G4N93_02715 [Dehalococcoidia bacterium]|nr:hypothetical protein [Dehalococcoidia bacterium]
MMKVFHIIMGIIKGFLLKVSPSLGYEGVINTQINIYNRLRKRAPEMPENDLLNRVIISRIRALPRVASEEEEYAHYRPLVKNPYKTLEDVIWAIVDYEYILSREEHIFNQFSQMGLSEPQILTAIDDQKAQMRAYVEESIENKVKKRS